MQTFLPSADFAESARSLDDRRLGKQRIEALQVFRALTREAYGWQRHPAVVMWQGYEEALVAYGLAVCAEWVGRGRRDTVADTLGREWEAWAKDGPPRSQPELARAGRLPPWLGDEALHRSHRSALLRKDPERYRAWLDEVPDNLPYHWPCRSERDAGT